MLSLSFPFQPVESKHGLLTTVAYQMGKKKPVTYALEVSLFTLYVSYKTAYLLLIERPGNKNYAINFIGLWLFVVRGDALRVRCLCNIL